ncbi:uncharacterized protein LOC120838847 [Ixodes scapularis]|uniref:uncharacterized protein LOC120838847 n=1 Tax=Ixodes scapularis TaxID=6945 RepID=UPI001C3814D1|nr:uncharacterized protein LOC120838847 [Ixodes scapularis]
MKGQVGLLHHLDCSLLRGERHNRRCQKNSSSCIRPEVKDNRSAEWALCTKEGIRMQAVGRRSRVGTKLWGRRAVLPGIVATTTGARMVSVDTPLGEIWCHTDQIRSRELPAHQAPETTQETAPAVRKDAAEGPTPEQPAAGITQHQEWCRSTRERKPVVRYSPYGKKCCIIGSCASSNDDILCDHSPV